MIRLSEHFTLEEFVRSRKAQARGIKNEPPEEAVGWMKKLCQQVLEPVRLAWGQPIFVNSGYRSPELNSAVGGVPNSQHCLGQAADIVADLSLLNYDLGRLIIQLSLPKIETYASGYHLFNAETRRRRGSEDKENAKALQLTAHVLSADCYNKVNLSCTRRALGSHL